VQNDPRCRPRDRRFRGDFLRCPQVRHKLEALTTTFGNTDTEIATDNVLRLLELLRRPDIPVAKGVERSFIPPYVRRADHVHGSNAMDDVELPEPKIRPTDEHASDLIFRMAKETPARSRCAQLDPSPTSRWRWSRRRRSPSFPQGGHHGIDDFLSWRSRAYSADGRCEFCE
jgi:hypothetical protein